MLKKNQALNNLKVTIVFLEEKADGKVAWIQVPPSCNRQSLVGDPMEFLNLWQAVSWNICSQEGLQNHVKNGTILSLCNERICEGEAMGIFKENNFFVFYSAYWLGLQGIPGIEK